MQHNLFISWNLKDKKIVEPFYKKLLEIEKRVINPEFPLSLYFCEENTVGNLDVSCLRSAENSDVIIWIVSKNSINSSYVPKELASIRYNKNIIPLLIEDETELIKHINETKLNCAANFKKNIENMANIFNDCKREILTIKNNNDSYEFVDDEIESIYKKVMQFSSMSCINKYKESCQNSFTGDYIDRVLLDGKNKVDICKVLKTTNVLIHGEGGIGKTIYLKQLQEKINNHKDRICLLLNCDELNDELNIYDLIYETFNKNIGLVLEKKKVNQIIFENEWIEKIYILFDGLDQIYDKVDNLIDKIKNLYILNETINIKDNERKVSIVFTSRNQDINLKTKKLMLRFDSYDKDEMISLYFDENKKNEISKLQLNKRIQSNPLFLSKALDIYRDNRTSLDNVKTLSSLYDEFFKRIPFDYLKWLKRYSNEFFDEFINGKLLNIKNLCIYGEGLSQIDFDKMVEMLEAKKITSDGRFSHITYADYFYASEIKERNSSWFKDISLLEKLIKLKPYNGTLKFLLMDLYEKGNKDIKNVFEESLDIIKKNISSSADEENYYTFIFSILKDEFIDADDLLKDNILELIYMNINNECDKLFYNKNIFGKVFYYLKKHNLVYDAISIINDEINKKLENSDVEKAIQLLYLIKYLYQLNLGFDKEVFSAIKNTFINFNKRYKSNINFGKYNDLKNFYDKYNYIYDNNVLFEHDIRNIDKLYSWTIDKSADLKGFIVVQNPTELENMDLSKVYGMVVIGDYSTEIKANMFEEMPNLTYLNIINVKSINDEAFFKCRNLVKVNIYGRISKLGVKIFDQCINLISLYANDMHKVPASFVEECKKLRYINIPNVSSIGENAFHGCIKLDFTKSVFDFEKITQMDKHAFDGCECLNEISLSSKLLSIPEFAFADCTNLKTVKGYMPMYICECAFMGCKNLTLEEVEFTEKVGLIDRSAFKNCSSIKKIDLSRTGISTINTLTFSECVNLKDVVLPKNLIEICDSAFFNCNKIEKINFPDTLKRIGAYSFKGCISLKYIVLNNVEEVKKYAFSNTGITYVDMSTSKIDTIKYNTFSNTKKLNKVIFPKELKFIEKYAFTMCKLETLDYSKCIYEIKKDENAFYECNNNYEFVNNENENNLSIVIQNVEEDKVFITDSDKYLTGYKTYIVEKLEYNCFRPFSNCIEIIIDNCYDKLCNNMFYNFKVEKVVLPSNIKEIPENCFAKCVNLTSINLDNIEIIMEGAFKLSGIKKIEFNKLKGEIPPQAFFECEKLKEVRLNEGIIKIRNKAFKNCISLKYINTPRSLEEIRGAAFEGCTSLSKFNFDSNIKEIGAFAYKGCNFDYVVIQSNSIKINRNAFSECKELRKVNFNGVADLLKENYIVVKDYAFSDCKKLSEIISKAKIIIESEAFTGCSLGTLEAKQIDDLKFNSRSYSYSIIKVYDSVIRHNKFNAMLGEFRNLTKLIIMDGVKKLNDSIFENVHASEIILPKSLEIIGNSCFKKNKKLKSIVIPDSVKDIGASAFTYCHSLQNIYISKNIKHIKPYTFKGDSQLKNIILPLNLEIIDGSVFENCTNLENIIIPSTVKEIKGAAFRGCINLKEINIGCGIIKLSDSTFEDCGNLNNVYLNDNILEIGKACFKNCKSLVKIDLPKNLNVLNSETFYGCKKISEINIPTNVEVIPTRCFMNCESLSNINFNNVVSILSKSFVGTDINFLDLSCSKISYIGQEAFKYNKKLTDIKFNSLIEVIPSGCFEGCDSLINISLNEVKIIEEKAFYGCYNLKEVNLNMVENISRSAFYKCKKISSIKLPIVKTIEEKAFSQTFLNVEDSYYEVDLSSVNYIGNDAFNGSYQLSKVKLGNQLKFIGVRCFPDNITLSTINTDLLKDILKDELHKNHYIIEKLKNKTSIF